ncbi:NADP-dependent 3-hydroxy acid dehydrogenase YdfG [Filimonas lacunae]|uniref:NADP-dependent 3-hydroxy acid dehydrogenase YdfG n=1 Tax=Filimonas lacunae TaxID=477680 RepID=A0A173MBB6_9BACT|nr:SDR family oxidoreductase [Filimonas lacunae]BAV04854.1 short-chain dehydrogenase/reductase SDR [Filimonas lacunae]SIT34667.1 NADP-dependent 3-hydroxy acid dehydrogenase YdfG [Filimonas lacunae]
MKTIFITGASSGIGKATALYFHQQGWQVIATMRSPEKEQELSLLPHITLLPLDVTSPDQIASCVARATALAKIDVVFNNAGHGLSGPLETYSDEQITGLLNTNLLSVIRITKAFIPYFRQQGEGLFIATSSVGGISAFPFSAMYHASKWALEGFSESMYFELSKLNIGIKTILPGGVRTDYVGRSMAFGAIPVTAYDAITDKANKIMQQLMQPENLTPPEVIAATIYEAATDGKDQIRYVSGEDGKQLYETRLTMGSEDFRKHFDQLFFGHNL